MDHPFPVSIILLIRFKDKCLCIVLMTVSSCGSLDGLVGVGLAAAAVGVVASGIAAAVIGSRRR